MRDMLLILNFDESSSRAIARALRAEHIYCEIVPGNISSEEIEKRDPLGLILSGGVKGGMPSGLQAEVAQNARPMLALGDAAAMLCRALGGDALQRAHGFLHQPLVGRDGLQGTEELGIELHIKCGHNS